MHPPSWRVSRFCERALTTAATARRPPRSTLRELFALSWNENWEFGIDAPLAALAAADAASAPLVPFAAAELAGLLPPAAPDPIAEGFALVPAARRARAFARARGWLTIAFDATSGAIVELTDHRAAPAPAAAAGADDSKAKHEGEVGGGVAWAAPEQPLALLQYTTRRRAGRFFAVTRRW